MIKEVILRDTKKSRFVYPDEVAGIYSLKRYKVIQENDNDTRQEFQIVGFPERAYGLLNPETNKIICTQEGIILECYLHKLLRNDLKVYVETDDE